MAVWIPKLLWSLHNHAASVPQPCLILLTSSCVFYLLWTRPLHGRLSHGHLPASSLPGLSSCSAGTHCPVPGTWAPAGRALPVTAGLPPGGSGWPGAGPAHHSRCWGKDTSPLACPRPAGDLRLLRLHLAALPLRLPGGLRRRALRVHGGRGQQDSGAESWYDTGLASRPGPGRGPCPVGGHLPPCPCVGRGRAAVLRWCCVLGAPAVFWLGAGGVQVHLLLVTPGGQCLWPEVT